jgi:hypothetical protein
MFRNEYPTTSYVSITTAIVEEGGKPWFHMMQPGDCMARIMSWTILTVIFLIAGYGLNLLREALMDKLSDPQTIIWWRVLLGFLLMSGGISYLGGFIYYRDKKRGKVKKPGWLLQKNTEIDERGMC